MTTQKSFNCIINGLTFINASKVMKLWVSVGPNKIHFCIFLINSIMNIAEYLREDNHKKAVLSQKRRNCQNPFQAIIRLKKKMWHGPLSH